MPRHGLADGEIEPVELSVLAPAGVCRKRGNGSFEVPAVERTGNQSAEEERDRMLPQGSAEIEPRGNSEPLEGSLQQGHPGSDFPERYADFAKLDVLSAEVENAA